MCTELKPSNTMAGAQALRAHYRGRGCHGKRRLRAQKSSKEERGPLLTTKIKCFGSEIGYSYLGKEAKGPLAASESLDLVSAQLFAGM